MKTSITLVLALGLILTGCQESGARDSKALLELPGDGQARENNPNGPVDDAPTDEEVESAVSRLERYLAGSFDSSAQAQEDPTYYAISLVMCPVDVPDLGDRVLYVEQAILGGPPYRQRLYVLEAMDPPETDARSVVYEFLDPSAVEGLCANPTRVSLSEADVSLRSGCDVFMHWDGRNFIGGTDGSGCQSSLNGATYATSTVEITETSLSSWDQGYDSHDEQVWGAVDGPYVFDRRVPIAQPE